MQDVVITGANGTVDGSGEKWWEAHRKKLEGNITRGHLVEYMYSSSLLLSNVTFLNSPFWTIHPFASTDIVARGVTVLNPHDSPNTGSALFRAAYKRYEKIMCIHIAPPP